MVGKLNLVVISWWIYGSSEMWDGNFFNRFVFLGLVIFGLILVV